MPFSAARASEPGRDGERPPGVDEPSGLESDRLLVGESGELGVDQEVGPAEVEREGHAVGLDVDAGLGRPPVVARAGHPEPSERDRRLVLDQQEPIRDPRRGDPARWSGTA